MYGSEGNSVKNKSRLENPTTHFKKNLKEIDQENVSTYGDEKENRKYDTYTDRGMCERDGYEHPS